MVTEYIIRDGRKIEVETLETSAAPKRRKREDHFIQVPLLWLEKLDGASGQTYRLALHLAYLSWREKGGTIVLSNASARSVGVSRRTKWRALRELERRGLVHIEQQPNNSPKIKLA
jgi:hypothetical protein